MSSVSIGEITAPPTTGVAPHYLRRLLTRPVATACVAYLAAIVIVAVVAPIVFPGVAHQQAGDLLRVRQGPSWGHLLGTDTLGRDLLERLLVGTRVTLVGVAEALVVTVALGVPLGLAAGYIGGLVDRAAGWLTDLTLSMPAIAIVLVALAVFPHSMLAAMVTLGVLTSPAMGRIVRSATLPVREEPYIAAAQVAGLSRRYIIARHVLPRIAGAIIVLGSLVAAAALLTQTGLSFLGLIVNVPAPSWGGMVGEGIQSIALQPWLIWPPGIAMTLTIVALGLLGDALRDTSAETWAAVSTPRRTTRGAVRSDLVSGPSNSLLRADGLTVAFPSAAGDIVVVDDVSFDIAPGETVGLLGESGCGKSVTAMSLLGALPGAGMITQGRVLLRGLDLTSLGERDLRRIRGKEIALVSQEPMVSLNPAFRVGSQLALSLRLHQHLSHRAARSRAVQLLHQVQLPSPDDVARRYPHELSGGMAQRVAIARALAGNPRLLIADEPTTALDVTVQAEILELLRELTREQNMALLVITHDWGVIADLCDRVLVMYAGQIVEEAEVVSLFSEPRHPYTEALLASNPQHIAEADLLPAIAGTVPRPGDWPNGCHFHPRCGYATPTCTTERIPLIPLAGGRATRCIHHEQLERAR